MTSSPATKPNPWIAHVRPRPQAALRLFCLPYSGGNASIFAGWADILPATIEVCPIQLPGHGSRITEPPLTEIGPDGFDVARDGRILLLEQVASSTERLVHVVVNWTPRRAPGT